jgi:protease I
MTRKILILVGDFVEDYEVMVPFQALKAVGFDVDVVCPDKAKGQSVKTSIHDFEGDQTYTEKPGHNFELNATFADVGERDYDALAIPGGRSPEYLRIDPRVIELVIQFAKNNKPIAAICHGPQVLAAARVIKGRRINCYPACSPDVELAGATYVPLPMDAAVTDGNFVTAPAWPAQGAWIAQLLALLGTKIELATAVDATA